MPIDALAQWASFFTGAEHFLFPAAKQDLIKPADEIGDRTDCVCDQNEGTDEGTEDEDRNNINEIRG